MATKKIDPVKAKAAKQKKIAIAGAVLLVLVMALTLPKTLKRLHGGSSGPDWRTQLAQPDATAAAPPAGLAAPTLAGSNLAPAPAPVTTTTQQGPLASETAPTAAVGQLASLGRFASKDPFASQAPTTPTATTPPAPPTPPTASTDGSIPVGTSGGTVGSATPAAPAAPLTSAVIAVNGVKGLVTVNGDFPSSTDASATPVFHLKSVSAHSAKVTIAGGSYADGAPSITLQEGKPVTLMNTADGTRYTLQLYPQGTPVTPATTGAASTTPAAPVLAPAPSTTAPATTTTPTTTKSGG